MHLHICAYAHILFKKIPSDQFDNHECSFVDIGCTEFPVHDLLSPRICSADECAYDIILGTRTHTHCHTHTHIHALRHKHIHTNTYTPTHTPTNTHMHTDLLRDT